MDGTMKKLLIGICLSFMLVGTASAGPPSPMCWWWAPDAETITCASNACTEDMKNDIHFLVSEGGAEVNADTLTLNDGSDVGEIHHFVLKTESDAGDTVVVDTAKQVQWTDCTFAEVGDSCTLIWDGTNWHMLSSFGL